MLPLSIHCPPVHIRRVYIPPCGVGCTVLDVDMHYKTNTVVRDRGKLDAQVFTKPSSLCVWADALLAATSFLEIQVVNRG
jgi:hypothetical protein